MSDNWALEAIQKEADRRAGLSYLGAAIDAGRVLVLGLNFKQIAYLQAEWLRQNPEKTISDIPCT